MILKYADINILDIMVEHLDIAIEDIRWLSHMLNIRFSPCDLSIEVSIYIYFNMFSANPNVTQLSQLSGKSLPYPDLPTSASVILTFDNEFLGGGILLTLKHILCIVASIVKFIPYNPKEKLIKATVGKCSVPDNLVSHYDVDDIQIENRELTKYYAVYQSLSMLTVCFKQNFRVCRYMCIFVQVKYIHTYI